MLLPPPWPASLSLSLSASLPVCLPLSSSMHYSFIILLQLPYRPHFGEDKTCHLWVLSGEMMGDFKGKEEVDWGQEEEEEAEGGCKECSLSPFFIIRRRPLSLSFYFSSPSLSRSLSLSPSLFVMRISL